MKTIKDITLLSGRILISIPFIISLFHRFTAFNWAVDYSIANGIVWATIFWVWAATIAETIGTILILAGYKIEFGSISLLLFMIPVTFIFHDFWTLAGADRSTQMGYFISNTAVIGGIILLIGSGAGRFSLDNLLKKKE